MFYIVKKNDTLYSISKHLNCNINKLLRYNNFQKPYKILIGQKILIDYISMTDKNNINYIIYNDKYKKHILYTSFLDKKINIINILNQNKSMTEICFFYNINDHKKNYNFSKKNISSKHWNWPIKNSKMIFFYNSSINNEGIEISGIKEQPIFAASNGKVVYIGDIFKSYGKLIIIKHNNNYLSLYGFNKNIFVKLNDQVHENQKISTMGCSKNNLAKLFFEIRFKGNSINLLNLFSHVKLKKY